MAQNSFLQFPYTIKDDILTGSACMMAIDLHHTKVIGTRTRETYDQWGNKQAPTPMYYIEYQHHLYGGPTPIDFTLLACCDDDVPEPSPKRI